VTTCDDAQCKKNKICPLQRSLIRGFKKRVFLTKKIITYRFYGYGQKTKSLYMASNVITKKELIKRRGEIERSMSEKESGKIGRNVLARGIVICFMTAIISSLAI